MGRHTPGKVQDMPTKTSVYIATSLDGFIARPDGSLDWLDGSGDNETNDHPETQSSGEDYGFKDFMDRIDSMILGRTTFQQVLKFGEWPYAGKHVIVPSSTLSPEEVPERLQPEVKIANGEPSELLSLLDIGGYKHAWIDGGKTIQRFLRAGLIDEITVSRIPVLIGAGIPLFGELVRDVDLEHAQTSCFDSGLVQSRYRVVRSSEEH